MLSFESFMGTVWQIHNSTESFSFFFFLFTIMLSKAWSNFSIHSTWKVFVYLFLNWRLKIANYITVKVTAQRPTIPRVWILSGHLWSIQSEKYRGNLNTMNPRQNIVIFSSISDPSLHPFMFFEQNENSVHHVTQEQQKDHYMRKSTVLNYSLEICKCKRAYSTENWLFSGL